MNPTKKSDNAKLHSSILDGRPIEGARLIESKTKAFPKIAVKQNAQFKLAVISPKMSKTSVTW